MHGQKSAFFCAAACGEFLRMLHLRKLSARLYFPRALPVVMLYFHGSLKHRFCLITHAHTHLPLLPNLAVRFLVCATVFDTNRHFFLDAVVFHPPQAHSETLHQAGTTLHEFPGPLLVVGGIPGQEAYWLISGSPIDGVLQITSPLVHTLIFCGV